MDQRSLLTLALAILSFATLLAQPSGWSVDDIFHVSFRYLDGQGEEQESSHWQPGNISFWESNEYNSGSSLTTNILSVYNPNKTMNLNLESLVFQDNGSGVFQDRVRLDYSGLNLVNGASWGALDAFVWGNAGQLDLYTGVNGEKLATLGATSENSGRGKLALYGPDGGQTIFSASSTTNYGYGYYYGTNNTRNLYFGVSHGNANAGRIIVYDESSVGQAGIYVNEYGEGIVWGDQKNFRMDDPTDDSRDIWYASLEGPEVAAYERGTATLQAGECFVSFSEHYRALANSSTMTVQLTPTSWDTYGLAVVEKSSEGFRVKELKAGEGNFDFDWEVKCIRKGKEHFEIYRPKLETQVTAEKVESTQGRFSQKVKANPSPNGHGIEHVHGPNCKHPRATN